MEKGIEDLASGKLLSKDLDQLAKRLGIDLGLLKVIAASSNEDGDFMRKYGPGSKSFQAISKTFPGFKNIECIRRKTKKQTKKTGLKIINVDLKDSLPSFCFYVFEYLNIQFLSFLCQFYKNLHYRMV